MGIGFPVKLNVVKRPDVKPADARLLTTTDNDVFPASCKGVQR